MLAAFAFSLIFEPLERSGLFDVGKSLLRKYPELPSAGGLMGFIVAGALFLVVLAANWLDPAAAGRSSSNWLLMESWHPAIAGVFVGLLEFPAAVIWNELIGSSQSYVTVAANAVKVTGRQGTSYLQKYQSGIGNQLQIYYMIAAVLGSFLASFLGHNFSIHEMRAAALSSTIPMYESLIGGFLLVFGARLAAGCTSGHGISGMGSLATGSYIAVCGMFGGAILLAVLRTFVF